MLSNVHLNIDVGQRYTVSVFETPHINRCMHIYVCSRWWFAKGTCSWFESACALSRDFAYVACDPEKCVHVCHVFRCESLAREIADTLHSICNRIMEDTGYQVVPGEPHDTTRPVDLPSGGSDQYLHCSALNRRW